MPELLDQLLDNEQQAQADARDAYRRLLARRDNPEPGDADLLRRTLAALGITSADFKADAAAVANVTRIERGILSADALKSADAERRAAQETFHSELRQLLRDLADSLDDLQLPHAVNAVMRFGVTTPKGSKPFHVRSDDVLQAWVAAQTHHMSLKGLHDQNTQQAAKVRAAHPRAFAD
jgi:hypothetical protein